MTDEDAFLAAIAAEPEEDTPRLVFADWLDERGGTENQDRAAFIRAQILLARTPAEDLRCSWLETCRNRNKAVAAYCVGCETHERVAGTARRLFRYGTTALGPYNVHGVDASGHHEIDENTFEVRIARRNYHWSLWTSVALYWRRGFVYRVTAPMSRLADLRAETLAGLARHPLTEVRVTDRLPELDAAARVWRWGVRAQPMTADDYRYERHILAPQVYRHLPYGVDTFHVAVAAERAMDEAALDLILSLRPEEWTNR